MNNPISRFRRALPTRGALAALIALPLAFLVAAPAQAFILPSSLSDDDKLGDMVYEVTATGVTGASSRANNDITKTLITYTSSAITVKVKFAELQQISSERYLVTVQTMTSTGRSDMVSVLISPSNWGGSTYQNTCGCSVQKTVNYDQNFVMLSFPPSNIGSPASLKFKVSSSVVKDTDGDGKMDREFRDDGFTDGRVYFTSNYAWSSSVYRPY